MPYTPTALQRYFILSGVFGALLLVVGLVLRVVDWAFGFVNGPSLTWAGLVFLMVGLLGYFISNLRK